jgi:hypothetical protein
MLAKLGRGMFRLLAALGAVVGLFAVVSMVLLAVYWPADPAQKELPKKIILSVALMPGLAELNADGPFQKLFSNARLSLFEIVRALDVAAEDDRVKGVFVNLTYADFGLAEAQELRAAISRLRAGGKVTHVFIAVARLAPITWQVLLIPSRCSLLDYWRSPAFRWICRCWERPCGRKGLRRNSARGMNIKARWQA